MKYFVSTQHILLACLLLPIAGPALHAEERVGQAPAPTVEAVFDDKGLASISVDGKTVPLFTRLSLTATLTDTYRNPYEMEDPYVADNRAFRPAAVKVIKQEFDAAKQRLTQTYEWGTVAATYTVNKPVGGLDMTVEIHNTSKDVK